MSPLCRLLNHVSGAQNNALRERIGECEMHDLVSLLWLAGLVVENYAEESEGGEGGYISAISNVAISHYQFRRLASCP